MRTSRRGLLAGVRSHNDIMCGEGHMFGEKSGFDQSLSVFYICNVFLSNLCVSYKGSNPIFLEHFQLKIALKKYKHFQIYHRMTAKVSQGIQNILHGIMRYRTDWQRNMLQHFKRVRDNPNPTAVFVTCVDSRMLPSRFTQTNVGDMFIIRNAGNMVPHR